MNLRFTALGSEAAEERVRRDLDLILAAVRENLPSETVSCVALIGGFGRGEGGVVVASDGIVTAFNDYDFAVITREGMDGSRLKEMAPELARQVGVDFVDFGVIREADLPRAPLTVFWYELREGHRVLLGDPDALKAVPAIDPARLPLLEGTRLLTNRGMSLLWAWLYLEESIREGKLLDEFRFRFTLNSIHKAVLAIGDAALIRAGRYDISYRERASLIPGVPLPFQGRDRDDFLAAHAAAIRFKLYPDLTWVPVEQLVQFWSGVCAWHETAMRSIESARLGGPVERWANYPARLAAEAIKESLRHPRRYLRERRSAGSIKGWPRFFLDMERSQRARLPFLLYSAGAAGFDHDLLGSGLSGIPAEAVEARDHWRHASLDLLAEWHP